MARLTPLNERNMSIRSPPPLHTPEPISPLHSLRAQWDALHHHLNSPPSSEAQSIDRRWLRTLNHNLLLTALAKKRSEIDLLTLEAKTASAQRPSRIDLEFPDYSVGVPRSHETSATSSPQWPSSPSSEHPPSGESAVLGLNPTLAKLTLSEVSEGRHPKALKQSSPLSKIHVPPAGIDRSDDIQENSGERNDQVSPLSPCFGPRQFDNFSGTVARRRSLPPSGLHVYAREAAVARANESALADPGSGYQTPARSDDGKSRSTGLRIDLEKRILWEAAWVEIEGHLEDYVGRFDEMGKMGSEDVWQELVRMKGVVEGLREQVRSAREDVRG